MIGLNTRLEYWREMTSIRDQKSQVDSLDRFIYLNGARKRCLDKLEERVENRVNLVHSLENKWKASTESNFQTSTKILLY